MNFIETVYNKVLSMKKDKFSLNDAARFTGFTNGFDKHTLADALDELVKQDRLYKNKSGNYCIKNHSRLEKCTILGTSKDYAFARPIGTKDKDIFISSANLNDACHGDTVLVEVGVTGRDRKYKRDLPLVASGKEEGVVVEILERGFKVVVGILSINDRGVATVLPDDRRFTDSVFVDPAGLNGATNNQKVVLDILDYPSNIKMARGVVREVLGDPNDVRVTTLSIIRSFNLFEEFPEDVIKNAKKVNIPVSEEDQTGRKDYRDRLIITIDGEDAKDFDDAISLTKTDDGNYNLGVYIADVSHYVREGSALDKEAFKRGTSVYFPDNVLPMLPVELSNGICSLNPNEDRFVLAVEMLIAPSGKILDYEIHKGIIRSAFRMTYTKVTKILEGDKSMWAEYRTIVPMLTEMQALAKILISRRDNAGQLDFDIPEPQIILNDDGTVKDVRRKPREMSDRLIEQFMVITNEVVARHFDNLKVPFVYRVHETPTLERAKKFKDFAASLGLKFTPTGKDPSPKDYQTLLVQSKDKDYSTALSKVMLRSMQKARYETENLGHFGLALRDYCHFTSPIRRYPDLTIHRIISAVLDGSLTSKKLKEYESFVADSAERSSTMERQAEEAERTVDAQKETEFMQSKIGEVYDGTISGVTENGIFVELENTIEGFISIARLPKGKYDYDEAHYLLRGLGKNYRIGDKIKIRVVGTDIVLRHIDFELADFHREDDEDEEYSNYLKTKHSHSQNNFSQGGKNKKNSSKHNHQNSNRKKRR